MAIAELLTRVTTEQQKLQAEIAQSYRGVVLQIADGLEPDPRIVAAALRDAGKSIEDLQAAVETLLKRRQLRERFDQIPKLKKQFAKVEGKIKEEAEAFQQVETKHADAIDILADERRRIVQQLNEAEKAKRELWETITDEALLARRDELAAAISAKHKELNDARETFDNRKERLRQAQRVAEHGGSRGEKAQAAGAAEIWQTRVEDSEATLSQLETELRQLQAEQHELQTQMLQPEH
jgi:chromosome segregation ATPase